MSVGHRIETWAYSPDPIPFDECGKELRNIADGMAEKPERYDRETFAMHLRTLANSLEKGGRYEFERFALPKMADGHWEAVWVADEEDVA